MIFTYGALSRNCDLYLYAGFDVDDDLFHNFGWCVETVQGNVSAKYLQSQGSRGQCTQSNAYGSSSHKCPTSLNLHHRVSSL